jgi:hypothetical protein
MSSAASSTGSSLQTALSEITELDAKIKAAGDEVDRLKERRDYLERLALEEMQTQRLDGVRVAGRSWRVEWAHSFSATEGRKREVMEAARQAGLLDAVTSVNTSRLKALLAERAKKAGRDSRQPYSEGTEFDGLVGEYVRPVLRHLTVS